MSEKSLAFGTLLAFVVVSILVLWALDFAIWPFGDEKVNCCTNKMLPNAQCAEVSKKQCEKVQGQVVEKCEDCMRQDTEIMGGGASSRGRPMAPP